ncbi:VOC family protein [soil metagenome]
MEEVMLTPYLNFQGNTEEALKFYRSVFGGELELSRFGDFPNAPAGFEDKIMHGTLKGDDISFMASEGMPGGTIVVGDNVNMSLSGVNEEKLANIFNSLAEGGNVIMPLAKQMWGDKFGMLIDKFGIHWLVNITAKKDS